MVRPAAVVALVVQNMLLRIAYPLLIRHVVARAVVIDDAKRNLPLLENFPQRRDTNLPPWDCPWDVDVEKGESFACRAFVRIDPFPIAFEPIRNVGR